MYVRYRSTGLTELLLLVETSEKFSVRNINFAIKRFMFQGIMVLLVTTPLMYSAKHVISRVN